MSFAINLFDFTLLLVMREFTATKISPNLASIRAFKGAAVSFIVALANKYWERAAYFPSGWEVNAFCFYLFLALLHFGQKMWSIAFLPLKICWGCLYAFSNIIIWDIWYAHITLTYILDLI